MMKQIEPTRCVILISNGSARRLSWSSGNSNIPQYLVFTDSLVNTQSITIDKIDRLWCFETWLGSETYPTIEEAIMFLKMSRYVGETIEVYRFPPDKDEFDILHTKIQRHSHTGFFKYVVDPEYLESLGFVKIY